MSDETADKPGTEYLVALLGLVTLGYIGGAYSGAFDVFPYPQLLAPTVDQLASADRVRGRGRMGTSTPPGPWHPTHTSASGVRRGAGSDDRRGATLLSSAEGPYARLVDRQGRQLHQWHAPFERVWPNPEHIGPSQPDPPVFWQRVELLDEGNLLALYTASKTTPYGYGLARLNADSEVVWRYDGNTHHDFATDDGGNIWTLTHTLRDTTAEPVSGAPELGERVLADAVVQLSPTGQEQRRIPLLEAFADSNFRAALNLYPTTLESDREKPWDILHTNAIELVGREFAAHHPFAEPGDLLIVCRTPDLIALLDRQTGEINWATRGFWWQPTDALPLPSGRILVFDSNGHAAGGLPSRLVEFAPDTQRITWAYTGRADQPFWSIQGGSVERLPDDGLLVTSPLMGTIEEISPSGELLWQYRNPVRHPEANPPRIAAVWSGRRIPPERLDFLQKAE